MSNIWPEGIKCAVLVSFDLDAETFWFSRNPASYDSPSLLAEGSYGPKVAMPRILDMLKRQNLKTTFFIPGWVIEKHPEICKQAVMDGHEIGYHGYLHENLHFKEQKVEMILKVRKIMKDLLGENINPVGYREPEAEVRPETLDVIANMGFEYSTNFMDADRPYLHNTSCGKSIVELPMSWLFDDSSHFFFTLQEPSRRPIAPASHVYEMWKEEFDGIYEEGGSMVLTLHPQIIGRVSRIKMLEDLITYMKSKPGTLIAQAVEIARLARKGLEK